MVRLRAQSLGPISPSLAQILPPSRDLYLISLATSPRDTVSLSARVRSGEIMIELSTRLRASGYSLKPPAIAPVSDRFGSRFQVNLEIDVPRNFTNTLELELVENRPAASASWNTPLPPPSHGAHAILTGSRPQSAAAGRCQSHPRPQPQSALRRTSVPIPPPARRRCP